MRSIQYFFDFDARSFGILRSLLPKAERVDLATEVFTLRQWLDLDPRLPAFVQDGGQLRVLVWPDGLSPAALDALCRLENTEVALARDEPAAHGQEFLVFAGNRLTVATASVSATYPGLSVDSNGGGGVLVMHPDYANDPAAREAVARFERRWGEATPVDARVLAEFKAQADGPLFQEGNLVRSTNELYKGYGVGRVVKVRNEHAKVEFNPSVFMPLNATMKRDQAK